MASRCDQHDSHNPECATCEAWRQIGVAHQKIAIERERLEVDRLLLKAEKKKLRVQERKDKSVSSRAVNEFQTQKQREVEDELKTVRMQLDETNDEYQKKANEWNTQASEHDEEIKKYKERVDSLEADLQVAKKDLIGLEDIRNERNELQMKQEQMEKKFQEKEKEHWEEMAKWEAKLSEHESEIKENEKQFQELQNKMTNELKNLMEKHQEEVQHLERRIAELEEENTTLQKATRTSVAGAGLSGAAATAAVYGLDKSDEDENKIKLGDRRENSLQQPQSSKQDTNLLQQDKGGIPREPVGAARNVNSLLPGEAGSHQEAEAETDPALLRLQEQLAQMQLQQQKYVESREQQREELLNLLQGVGNKKQEVFDESFPAMEAQVDRLGKQLDELEGELMSDDDDESDDDDDDTYDSKDRSDEDVEAAGGNTSQKGKSNSEIIAAQDSTKSLESEGKKRRHVTKLQYQNHRSGLKGIYTGYVNEQGEPDSRGTLRCSNGDIYEGEWLDGVIHGQGVYTWSDGDLYTGPWIDGIRYGHGVFLWSDGRYYDGDYVNGMRHGKGTTTRTDGARYEGEYKEDLRHGYGVNDYPDGRTYKGEYENDRPHGRGIETSSDGDVLYEGIWERGEFVGYTAIHPK